MSDSEPLEVDILFVGATRPAMIYGVTYEFAVLNVMAILMLFLAVANPFYLILVVPTHIIGFLMSMNEPRIFQIFMVWLTTIAKCRNRVFWKKSTYTPH